MPRKRFPLRLHVPVELGSRSRAYKKGKTNEYINHHTDDDNTKHDDDNTKHTDDDNSKPAARHAAG